MALNSLLCADVPLRNCSINHYASSAWKVFANATDLNKIQSCINKSKRAVYCSPDLPDFEN